MLLSLQQNGALNEKWKQGRDVSATLSPFKLKEVLCVIEAVVYGKKRMALLDSGMFSVPCDWIGEQSLKLAGIEHPESQR